MVSAAVLLNWLAQAAMRTSPSVIVTDYATGAVLVAEDAETSKYPASLTKLMTLYLLFEAVEEGRVTLDQKFPVSKNAARQPPTKL